MKKNILKLSAAMLIFNFIFIPVVMFLGFVLNINFNKDDTLLLVIIDFAVSLVIFIAMIYLYKDIIKDSIAKIKNDYKGVKIFDYLKYVFIAFFMLFVFKMAGAIFESLIAGLIGINEISVENQELIEKLLASAPAMMIISACIFAPVSEEILFRGAIDKVIKNKWVFITVSGLTFGLMHVTDNIFLIIELIITGVVIDAISSRKDLKKDTKKMLFVTSIVLILLIFGSIYFYQYGNLIQKIISIDIEELIGSITYISMGAALAFLYKKDNNIITNISVHALNNIISMIALLFIK